MKSWNHPRRITHRPYSDNILSSSREKLRASAGQPAVGFGHGGRHGRAGAASLSVALCPATPLRPVFFFQTARTLAGSPLRRNGDGYGLVAVGVDVWNAGRNEAARPVAAPAALSAELAGADPVLVGARTRLKPRRCGRPGRPAPCVK